MWLCRSYFASFSANIYPQNQSVRLIHVMTSFDLRGSPASPRHACSPHCHSPFLFLLCLPYPNVAAEIPCTACRRSPECEDFCRYDGHVKLLYGVSDRNLSNSPANLEARNLQFLRANTSILVGSDRLCIPKNHASGDSCLYMR